MELDQISSKIRFTTGKQEKTLLFSCFYTYLCWILFGMELIIGHFYTYKKGKRRWTVVFEAFTKKDNLIIVRGSNGFPYYVNPTTLRSDKRTTLEAKLCGHISNTSDLYFNK